ncbi:MAG: M14 family metallopeptidase [Ignavibacteriales bacterium]|nr:M14 family metallopeptidase [Ignavibacteriales bacterium]
MKSFAVISIVTFISLFAPLASAQEHIPSPEEQFGFRMGSDRMLIDWKDIVSYFSLVDSRSDRVKVDTLGTSTLGKPFIMAIVSSSTDRNELGRIKRLQQRLAYPDKLSVDSLRLIAESSKTVVLMTMNIHSTEIASSQESVELLYELATASTKEMQQLLDNVVILIIPSLNPDGLQLTVDWYKKQLNTPSEGTAAPELFHPYAGHDNNRDWFMYNLVESRLTAKVLYKEWFPEIVLDQHQMQSNGARIFLPPYEDPVNPNVPSELMSEINLLGEYMVTALQRSGKSGAVTGTSFTSYFQGTMVKTPLWHNRIGILSEAASVRIATPIYFSPGSVIGMGDNLIENKMQTNHLRPFTSGWWRLRDIIDYEKETAYALLDFAHTFKFRIKTNYAALNRKATEEGETHPPYGYYVPIDQHDPHAAVDLVRRLMLSGVQVEKILRPAAYRGTNITEGSYYISLAQPARAYVKDLFERQLYPSLKQYPGGPPLRPYDITAWTLPMQMGVDVVPIEVPVKFESEPVVSASFTVGPPTGDGAFYVIERRFTQSMGCIFDLLKQHLVVREANHSVRVSSKVYPAGTCFVGSGKAQKAILERWELPQTLCSISDSVNTKSLAVPRIGLYQPYAANTDEGWTRYFFDQYHVPYLSLHNDDFKKNGAQLKKNFDIIIFPDMSTSLIVDGKGGEPGEENAPVVETPELPKEYQGGIGKEGTEAVKEFLLAGGTLITLASSSNFAIEKLRVPAVNALKGISTKDYYAPGTLVTIRLNMDSPLSYGMPSSAFAFIQNDPAFRLLPYVKEIDRVAWFDSESPLASGWLIGEDILAGKTALADIPYGKGRVVMFGFHPQNRAQTVGTFKLLYNALLMRN